MDIKEKVIYFIKYIYLNGEKACSHYLRVKNKEINSSVILSEIRRESWDRLSKALKDAFIKSNLRVRCVTDRN